MGILKYLLLTTVSILATACYENTELDIKAKPVLCINSLITAGRPIEVEVTRTRLFTESITNTDLSVSDALVTIYANESQVDAGYIPQQGDEIRIVAQSDTYGRAEAEVTVPFAASIKTLKFIPKVNNIWKEDIQGWELVGILKFDLFAELEITDQADVENYYYISYLSFNKYWLNDSNYYDYDNIMGTSEIEFYIGQFNYDVEPIFSEHIGIFESAIGYDSGGFSFFTDKQFSGNTYTLHMQYTDCGYEVRAQSINDELFECGYEFSLHTISRSYYNWLSYLWHRDDGLLGEIGDVGLGDPLWGYSNVSTGAGIVAAQAVSACTINLDDFIKTTLTQAK